MRSARKASPTKTELDCSTRRFMGSFTPALPYLQEEGVKVAVNAGASDTEMLAKLVAKTIGEKGLSLKVAWIEGDDVMETVNKLMKRGEKFENICFGGELEDWGFEPLAAQCYLGGAGIAEAFRQGADIVICGRVADAAPTIGAAMWWHGWIGVRILTRLRAVLWPAILLSVRVMSVAGTIVVSRIYLMGVRILAFRLQRSIMTVAA
jgi:Acyclic terpene utilisation family protein AtuA